MGKCRALVLGLFIWMSSGAAFAQTDDDFMQSDVMEVQRCIWRCQSNHGSTSKAYQQCIDTSCSGEPVTKKSKPRSLKKKPKRIIRNPRNGDTLIRKL